MLLVTYDFRNDKMRTKFSKFLKKFGRRIQYSVFEVKNSQRILKNIKSEIELKYQPNFSNVDSVLIYSVCNGCKKKVGRFGSHVHEEEDVIFFGSS